MTKNEKLNFKLLEVKNQINKLRDIYDELLKDYGIESSWDIQTEIIKIINIANEYSVTAEDDIKNIIAVQQSLNYYKGMREALLLALE